MSRCLIIINTVSGGGRARRYVMELQWQLSALFDRLEVKFTRQAGDATQFAIEASNEGFDAIFCMGGDGTINETVNGIVKAGCRAKFGFIPIGTVNDMSRALGIPLQPLEAIHGLKNSTIRHVDIGRCNDGYFCNNIAIGVIPEVVASVTPKEKQLLGPLAYFAKGGQALFTTKDYRFSITTEEGTQEFMSPLVIALLTNVVSSFEHFMPTASVDDGYMRIIIFKEYFIMNLFFILPLILSGSIYNSKYVTILKVKQARIEVCDTMDATTNMDGDIGPDAPVELEVLPKFLQVYVPNKRRKKTTNLFLNPLQPKS